MDKKMLDAMNEQLREEINSAYLYLAMSSDMKAKNYNGTANWFRVQATEESVHSMKFYNFIHDMGEQPILPAIEKPQMSWDSALDAFKATLAHEKHITSCIHKLVKLAREIGDMATEAFLQWFVTEQVEEEATADEIIQQIMMIGESPQTLFLLDRELGARQTTATSSASE